MLLDTTFGIFLQKRSYLIKIFRLCHPQKWGDVDKFLVINLCLLQNKASKVENLLIRATKKPWEASICKIFCVEFTVLKLCRICILTAVYVVMFTNKFGVGET